MILISSLIYGADPDRASTDVARRKAWEAREAALKAAAAAETAKPALKPSEWSFNDCVKWLRYHDLKDFVDTFYNNGFEGRQLVALQVRLRLTGSIGF